MKQLKKLEKKQAYDSQDKFEKEFNKRTEHVNKYKMAC